MGVGTLTIDTSITTGVPSCDRPLQRGLELGSRVDLDAVDPVGLGDRRVVRVHRVAALAEHGPVRRVERGLLEPGDRAEGVVVHDDPDDGDVLFARGGEHGRVLPEAAVADE